MLAVGFDTHEKFRRSIKFIGSKKYRSRLKHKVHLIFLFFYDRIQNRETGLPARSIISTSSADATPVVQVTGLIFFDPKGKKLTVVSFSLGQVDNVKYM